MLLDVNISDRVDFLPGEECVITCEKVLVLALYLCCGESSFVEFFVTLNGCAVNLFQLLALVVMCQLFVVCGRKGDAGLGFGQIKESRLLFDIIC